MFGYIRPLESELLVKELELYKSVYCGLCRALKKHVSFLMPMTLSYDCTLLAILRMALGRIPPRSEKHRCIASPFKKKCSVCSVEGDQLCYTARAWTVLVYYKLKDDIKDRDKGFFKRFFRTVLMWLITPSFRRILKKDSVIKELSVKVRTSLDELGALEKEASCDLDTLAAVSGSILSLAASAGMEGESREIAEKYGLCIGKWLYIIDAFDDLENDQKKNCFNPLILRFGSIESARSNAEAIDAVLSHYIDDAMTQLESLKPTCYNNILKNITALGLEKAGQTVLFKSHKPSKTKGL